MYDPTWNMCYALVTDLRDWHSSQEHCNLKYSGELAEFYINDAIYGLQDLIK